MKAALVGDGIRASLTPAMHMAEAAAQGFSYEYEMFDTTEAPYAGRSLADIVAEARDAGLAGLNITHPFKIEAAGLADRLVGSARELGTVNTLVFENGETVGYNTDYVGFRSALRRFLPAARMGHVLLAGAGGAGRSVALGLIDQGVDRLTILEQDTQRGEQLLTLLKRLRPNANVKAVSDCEPVDFNSLSGFVNATPMGMASHPGTAIDPVAVKQHTWVADIVYFPQETTLLARAKMRGCRVMNGSGMAIFQAVAAFQLLTDTPADADRMVASFQALHADIQPKTEAQSA